MFADGKAGKKTCIITDNVISIAEIVGNVRVYFEKTALLRLQNNVVMKELSFTGYTA